MKKKGNKQHRYPKKIRVMAIAGSSVMAVLGAACLTVAIVLTTILGRINFTDGGDVDPNADVHLEEEDNGITGEVVDPNDYLGSEVMELPLRGNESGVRNILLLGIDSDTFSGRSDTTMILSINDRTKTIKLVSLLRDTWVSIPGRDKNNDGKDDICKLNAAYAYGKHKLQNQMIIQNFRLDIDDYIGVNFKVLPIVIDAIGGIDVSLSQREMTQIPADDCKVAIPRPGKLDDCNGAKGFVSLNTQYGGKAGTYHLNGFQAMQYARIRKLDSDFGRTERQREVVSLMIKKAKTMSYSQLVSVLYKALECVDTNMSSDEFLGFAASAVKYAQYEVKMDYSVPKNGEYKGAMINGGAGLLLTEPKTTVQKLHEYLYN